MIGWVLDIVKKVFLDMIVFVYVVIIIVRGDIFVYLLIKCIFENIIILNLYEEILSCF